MKVSQRYEKGDFVKVIKDLPSSMSHFPCGFIGMVEGSYRDLCGSDGNGYSIIQFDNKMKPINTHAWYPEETLKPFSTSEVVDKIIKIWR